MREEITSVERLIGLLGSSRTDREVLQLIDDLGREVTIFIDKDDGANDEYMEVKSRGLSLYFDAGRLASVFLYSEQKDTEYCTYALPLPEGVSFGQSKSDVLRSLGSPVSMGGGTKGFFGDVPEWIKFDKREYSLHLEFASGTGSLQMVTLMPIEVKPTGV
jgi:hypothetical protein